MDLNAPLGTQRPPPRRPRGPIAGLALALLAAGAFGFYYTHADPHGGEPFAAAPLPAAPLSAGPSQGPDPMTTGSIAPAPRDQHPLPTVGQMIVPGQSTQSNGGGGPLIIDVSRALDEAARQSHVQSWVPSGLTKVDPAGPQSRPRVAIFISGLGLNSAGTKTALALMPPDVTFAFLPYGDGLTSDVAAAKAKNHEILLQLPLENAGGVVPGPHSLRAHEADDAARRDLDWAFGQIAGYDGVTNLLGAPVTGDQVAMTRILTAVAQRGLFYLDDGTARGSQAAALGPALHLPVLRADLVLDATTDPATVQKNLDRLVALARTRGSAIGMATGFPDHMQAIARFASQLDALGVTLVPIGAMAHDSKSLTTSR